MNNPEAVGLEKSEGLTLLYVEDEPLLQEEVATYLRRRVGTLLLASNGREALQIYNQHLVDAVMTDLLMPEMDGMHLLSEIRATNNEIPFVIATAINDFKTMQQAIQLGVTRFLIKPFQTEHIDEALSAIKQKLIQPLTSPITESLSISWSKAQLGKTEAELAKLIKDTSSKGPSRVTLNCCANLTEVVIHGAYTKMEHTLLENSENERFINFYRETYYRHLEVHLKRILNANLSKHNQLITISCNAKRQMDILKWMS